MRLVETRYFKCRSCKRKTTTTLCGCPVPDAVEIDPIIIGYPEPDDPPGGMRLGTVYVDEVAGG